MLHGWMRTFRWCASRCAPGNVVPLRIAFGECVDGVWCVWPTTETATNNTSITSSISIDESREVFDHWRCHKTAEKTLADFNPTNLTPTIYFIWFQIFARFFLLLSRSPLIRFGRVRFLWTEITCDGHQFIQTKKKKKEEANRVEWIMKKDATPHPRINDVNGWKSRLPFVIIASNDWLAVLRAQFTAGCGGMSTLPDIIQH